MPNNYYITIPNGKKISLSNYVTAWKRVKKLDPDTYVEGWQWFGTKARFILQDMRAGLHDRINQRGANQ